MSNEATIIGYSGHAYVVLDIMMANNYKLIGYCDVVSKEINPFNLRYLGTEANSDTINKIKNYSAFLGIGDNVIRGTVYKRLQQKAVECPVAIHPNATVSNYAEVGSGSVIMAGAVINAFAKIGNAVICNTLCIIEHECIINSCVHIAPGAVLAGNVIVGENSFIGANAVIKQGITIGSDVIIGAGAVVTKNIPNRSVVYGNPAKKYEK